MLPLPLCKWSDADRIAKILSGTGEAEGPEESGRHYLLCVFCKNRITSVEEGITVDGKHQHILINPAGESFRVGCFGAAVGCRGVGSAAIEHTWFAGFRWKIAVCLLCGVQLGWHYQDAAGWSFHGLILNRLIEH